MEGLSFPFGYSPLFGPFAFVFAFLALCSFPGTLDVAVWDHEGPTARTLTYSRELGCIPCPKSSDSKTTETDVALADLGQDAACGFTLVAEGYISLRPGKNEC